ncbi:MAG: SDR family NAD(P)-dependent oxidoreductase [Acidimicrobiales bacterium]
MAETLDPKDSVALVAGGTGGIGRHITAHLAGRGATVFTVSRTDSGADNHIAADLRSADEARRAVLGVHGRTGRLDIVVNAVGVVAFGDAVATSVDTVEELFLTNTFAHIFLCSAALPLMQKGGVITAISGVVAEQNLPGMAAYGASKAAVRSFNEAFAREARRVGVRVVDARPPHTETGLASRPVAGTAPRFPLGLDPAMVAERVVGALLDGTTDLPSSAFGS